MRFWLLDRISSYSPNEELTAVKNVSLAEEYLADHFPQFPVLPGVFMLESATQSAAWLIRLSDDYAHSVVVLKETRAVKFTDFVTPGNSLRMSVQLTSRENDEASFTFRGEVDGSTCVTGRLTMQFYTLGDEDPQQAGLDARMIEYQREIGALLLQNRDPEPVEA
jgi:3-hydroxyacyl-[acyl-carrier-protein] dehydratase